VERLVEDREVMVSHQRDFAPLADQIEAFHRIGPVADDVAQAKDVLHAAAVNLRQNGGEGFEVAVNITDDREHRLANIKRTASKVATSYGWGVGRSICEVEC